MSRGKKDEGSVKEKLQDKKAKKVAEIRELRRPGDLVLYDVNYDDMFDVHTKEMTGKEVGMVISAEWPRSIKVKWQRSGMCDVYHRCELTVLSRVTQE